MSASLINDYASAYGGARTVADIILTDIENGLPVDVDKYRKHLAEIDAPLRGDVS